MRVTDIQGRLASSRNAPPYKTHAPIADLAIRPTKAFSATGPRMSYTAQFCPSRRCARPNTPASAARVGASSRARSTICYRATKTLTLEGKRSLKILLAANRRLNTAYVLKEVFGQLWDYGREGWARRFFDNWRASLKWQRLGPYERFADMIDRHWDGIAAYCKPENKVSLGFVEGLNNKIRVFQRRAYGLRDNEYLRLKVLTCMLPPL